MQKQRDFQAGMLLAKNGGLAPEVEKCVFPREKATRYGFHPLKRPGFLLKRSQSMRFHSENTRVQSQTTHKATIVTGIRAASVRPAPPLRPAVRETQRPRADSDANEAQRSRTARREGE